MQLFLDDDDYAAFEATLIEAVARFEVRLLAFCVMPNHWHLVLVAPTGDELTSFLHWLTLTHASRWQLHHGTVGSGPVYQGRYRAFAVGTDAYFHSACRYVERNALRANLVERAEDWRWGSLWHRLNGNPRGLLDEEWMPKRSDWCEWVNAPQSAAELEALRRSGSTGEPFGKRTWAEATSKRLGLPSPSDCERRKRRRPPRRSR